MRTTLTLSDDAFLIARQLAAQDRVSLGKAVSRLARDGAHMRTHAPLEAICKSKYAILRARAEAITPEHVRRLMDEEEI